MIDFYTWSTPNGFKVSIALEEMGLPYTVIPINIMEGDQFKPEFLKISPNNKMPAIVDRDAEGDPYAVFESGAILMYLAEKTGQLMPQEWRSRYEVIQWLMFQMAGVGPMLGQVHHFRQYAPETIPYAVERYTKEAGRLYGVLDRRLAEVEYLAGAYSIADIAVFPWIRSYEQQGQDLEAFTHLKPWFDLIAARPAVQRGLAVPATTAVSMDEKARDILFGTKQYSRG